MKRITFLLGLFVGAILLSACASVPKTVMSPNDVSMLKGQWEGQRDMIWGRYRSFDHTVLEIYNDSIPLKGKISIAFMDGTDPREYSFENGVIDPQGNLSVQLEKDVKFVLSLYREENRSKMDGNYTHRGNEGRLTLYKKRG